MSAPLLTVFGAAAAEGAALARAIVRDPQRRFRLRLAVPAHAAAAASDVTRAGAEVMRFDPDAPASVAAAMRGAHGAFCALPDDDTAPETMLARAHAMAWAASREGVGHVVWSTSEDTREYVPCGTTMPVRRSMYNVPAYDVRGEANRAFVAGTAPSTLLYPAVTWECVLRAGLDECAQADGTLALRLPLGDARLPGIAADDVGRCAFAVFARGEATHGKCIGIAGEHLCGRAMAEQLALALDAPVVHAPGSADAFAASGTAEAADLANLFRFLHDFEHAYANARSVSAARELHPGTLSFAAWLARWRMKRRPGPARVAA